MCTNYVTILLYHIYRAGRRWVTTRRWRWRDGWHRSRSLWAVRNFGRSNGVVSLVEAATTTDAVAVAIIADAAAVFHDVNDVHCTVAVLLLLRLLLLLSPTVEILMQRLLVCCGVCSV